MEEVQCLWGEVRQQVTETEHLLSARMKAVSNGNDSFSFLAHIDVLHRVGFCSGFNFMYGDSFLRQSDEKKQMFLRGGVMFKRKKSVGPLKPFVLIWFTCCDCDKTINNKP